jgi:hypothetical protein
MVRQKKEWVCAKCETKYLAWQGICNDCGFGGTLEEKELIPSKTVSKETPVRRKIRRRWKDSERGIARRMQDVDGADPMFSKITTSTGRVGAITHLQFDAVSKNYVTENKNVVLAKWIIDAWIQIQQRAIDFNKQPLLHFDPPNMPKTFPINGTKQKTETMAIITQSRHEDLIRCEQALTVALEALVANEDESYAVELIDNILHPHNNS